MYFSLPLRAASTGFGYFLTFSGVLSMFILSKKFTHLIDIKWLFEWRALNHFDLLTWMVAFGHQPVELIKFLHVRRPKFLVQLKLI